MILGDALAEAATKKEAPLQLEVMEAGRNRLENKGIIAISKGLHEMRSLKCLVVPQNGIKEAGMTQLLDSLTGESIEVGDG